MERNPGELTYSKGMRSHWKRWFPLLLACLVPLLQGEGAAWAAAKRYYIVVGGVKNADGSPKDAQDPTALLARQALVEELARRPEVSTQEAGLPAEGPALAAELARRKLKGYEVTLRLLKVGKALSPPPPGRRFQVLEQSVRLSMVGTTLPGAQLTLGGDGESSLQAEVGATVSPHQEQELLREALRDAIRQAVGQALRKLQVGGTIPPPEKPRKRR